MLQHEEVLLLYDEKKSQKRDKTSPACGGVFDSHSSEEVLYDAVTSVNVCVFSNPCEAMESTSYTISISALRCKRMKEMKLYLSPREQISPMNCELPFCIYYCYSYICF